MAAARCPLRPEHGEAFQFDWSTEYTFTGGLRRRVELAHAKLCAIRALWLVKEKGLLSVKDLWCKAQGYTAKRKGKASSSGPTC